ncbi:MAG: FtsX-like permease family protein [Egibacteraceae bacterium]
MLGFFTTGLLVFAGVSLFVGAFIIYTTFTIIVAQRTRELALLRAVGASRRQVLSSVLVEALTVGLVGSLVGLVLGFGVAPGLCALLAASRSSCLKERWSSPPAPSWSGSSSGWW